MIDFVENQGPETDEDERQVIAAKGRAVVYGTSNHTQALELANLLANKNPRVTLQVIGRYVVACINIVLLLSLPALAAATQNDTTEHIAVDHSQYVTCQPVTEGGLLSALIIGLCILALIESQRRK